MKKSLLTLLLVSAAVMTADASFDSSCEGPLEPCGFGVEASVGFAPSFWLDRCADHYESCRVETPCALNDDQGPEPLKFNDMFGSVPFYFSAGLFYNACESIQIFGEFALRQAFGQDNVKQECACEGQPKFNAGYCFDNYRSLGGYAGFRHYCGMWWDCVAPYWGTKVGAWHHSDLTSQLTFNGEAALNANADNRNCWTLYSSNTVVSGGLVLGFTSELWECIQFRFGVEVIASGCLKPNTYQPTFSIEPISTKGTKTDAKKVGASVVPDFIKSGRIGTDLMIPVTFGLQYEF